MARNGHTTPKSFFWEGLLILLPVVLLAGVGLYALRQDEALARHDAAERARQIAGQISRGLWNSLSALPSDPEEALSFQTDQAGRLVFPPPYEPIPTPHPHDLRPLSPDLRLLWIHIGELIDQQHDSSAAFIALDDFLDKRPPADLAAAAHYRLGLLLCARNEFAPAAQQWGNVVNDYPDARTENDLSLPALAMIRLLELTTNLPPRTLARLDVTPDRLGSNLVFRPSPITPFLLSWLTDPARPSGLREHGAHWEQLWTNLQTRRDLYGAARHALSHPTATSVSPELDFAGTDSIPATALASNGVSKIINVPPHLFWFTVSHGVNPAPAAAAGATTNAPEAHPPNEREQVWLGAEITVWPGKTWVICRPSVPSAPSRPSRVWLEGLDNLLEMAEVPRYAGLKVEVAGRTLWDTAHAPAIGVATDPPEKRPTRPQLEPPELLASAVQPDKGSPAVRVQVLLTDPPLLFLRQQQRHRWFGAVIGFSALTALIGFVSARRAFHKQQRLTELKSNFVSSVSHELRAPIASIRLLAEGLERGRVVHAPKQNEYFSLIVQECRRLSSMIENVLDFSRIEQGGKKYQFEPTNLSALVRETVRLMEPQAAERAITMTALLPEQPVEAEVDGGAIQQALLNLIDNALKHSPSRATVQVGLELHDSAAAQRRNGGSSIHLWVSDQGEGIPTNEQERIFERFYRRGSEMRRETSGVGIGLSLVKHIITAHHGQVRVESSPGQPTRFILELLARPTRPSPDSTD